jgi:hypothetical protein
MAEVILFPGVTPKDLELSTSVDGVLSAARNASLVDVAYVGRAHDGSLVLGFSLADGDSVIGLLTRGIAWLSECQTVTSSEADDPVR